MNSLQLNVFIKQSINSFQHLPESRNNPTVTNNTVAYFEISPTIKPTLRLKYISESLFLSETNAVCCLLLLFVSTCGYFIDIKANRYTSDSLLKDSYG